jgi:hypothetical protein
VSLYAKQVHFSIVATTQKVQLHKTGSEKVIAIFALVDLLTFRSIAKMAVMFAHFRFNVIIFFIVATIKI